MASNYAVSSRMRVAEATPEHINARLRRQTRANILYYAQHPDEIDRRLEELDAEWDVERAIETNAGILSLAGLALGVFSRKWRLLPLVVAGFLVQHALQGWCPPVSVFRRMGVRTAAEINQEREALKALRGDYKNVLPDSQDDPCEKAGRAMVSVGLDGR